jgi:4-carboxymuconolactone decarboxylase
LRLTTPRIEPVSDADATPEQMTLMAGRRGNGVILNVYRTLVNAPQAAEAFLKWGRYILSERNDLPARQREIVILRTGFLCRSGYEWTQHVRVGKAAGLTDEEIERIKQGAVAEGWDSADSALIQAADELHKDFFICDKTWSKLGNHFTRKQQMDLVFTVGQYTQVSMILNSFGVQLDPGQTLDPDLKAH